MRHDVKAARAHATIRNAIRRQGEDRERARLAFLAGAGVKLVRAASAPAPKPAPVRGDGSPVFLRPLAPTGERGPRA